MAKCNWCRKKGLFLAVDSNRLCKNCQPYLLEIESKARVLRDSVRLAQEGKTFKTRLSRCELAIENASSLVKFERKGIRTVSPSPSSLRDQFTDYRNQIILEEAMVIVGKADAKAEVASTHKAKERQLSSALLKIRELSCLVEGNPEIIRVENDLITRIHQTTLDGFLEAARKAEFKGNKKKAIDQYQEALYFVRNDGIDDSLQTQEIEQIESKLQELGT